MSNANEGLSGPFARASRTVRGLVERFSLAIKGWLGSKATPKEVLADRAKERAHQELISGFDSFYALLGGRESWRTDPLKVACVHLVDRRLNVGQGSQPSWSQYLPALKAELVKQQRNQAQGIAPDEDFALAMRYAEAKMAANRLPTAKDRVQALTQLDRADRQAWAAIRGADPTPSTELT